MGTWRQAPAIGTMGGIRDTRGGRTTTTTSAGAIPEPMSNTPIEGRGGSGATAGAGEEGVAVVAGEVKFIYQNVGTGGIATDVLLQTAVEKEAVVVVVAEPWGKKGARKTIAGYDVAYDSDDVPGPPRERRFASGPVRGGPGPRGRVRKQAICQQSLFF